MPDVDWDLVSYVMASKYRVDVVADLAENGEATPSTIAADTPHEVAHVSRALRELREKGVVELLVSEDTKKGRIHGLTDDGRDVAQKAREVSR